MKYTSIHNFQELDEDYSSILGEMYSAPLA